VKSVHDPKPATPHCSRASMERDIWGRNTIDSSLSSFIVSEVPGELGSSLTFEVSVSLDNAVVWSFSPCATCSGRPGMSFAGGDDAKQEVADVIG
jgi:hypothetical protein